MAFRAFPKAFGHTALGVVWRMAVFGTVVLCFTTLIQLRQWYTSFAPSDAWASEAEKAKDLAWSDELAAATRAMARARPVETYPSKETFYKALLRSVQEAQPADFGAVRQYRLDRKSREALEAALLARIDSPDALDQNSQQLTEVIGKVAELDAISEHLRTYSKRDPIQEKVLNQVEDELGRSRKKMVTLQEQVQGLVNGRGSIEMGFQKKLAVVSSRIKKAEEGIKEAFDAVEVPARPVQHLSMFREHALWVGNESDPQHVIYLIAWYGLETTIVLLLCVVMAPWLIRLFGDASDPKDVQSKVTEQIKALLAAAFNRTTAAALAMVAVGGAAAAGVALAAGDQPSILPPIRHDVTTVAGAKGDPGEPGQPGADGANGENGEDGEDGEGKNGEDGSCGQCSTSELKDLLNRLEQQAAVIAALQAQLVEIDAKAERNISDVLDLNRKVAVASGNIGNLSSGMASLNKDMSNLSGSIGGLYSANQSILEISHKTRQQVLGSLHRLETESLSTTSQVQAVRATVDQAARDVPPVASDLLWMNAPNGVWARISPFRHYEVTPRVKQNVERAMGGVDPDQKKMILEALGKMNGKSWRSGWRFRNKLRQTCPDEALDTLREWTPLIVRLSRVQ